MKYKYGTTLPVYDFERSQIPEGQMLLLMAMARRVRLDSLGYRVQLVGGALRDLYLGGIANDIDIYMDAKHFARFPHFRPLGEYTGEITEKSKYEGIGFKVVHFEPSSSRPKWRPVDLIIYNGTLEQYIDTFDFGINQIWWDFEGKVQTYLLEQRLTHPGEPIYVNNRFNTTCARAEGLCDKYSHLGFKHDVLEIPIGKSSITTPPHYVSRGTWGRTISAATSSVTWTDGDLYEHTR